MDRGYFVDNEVERPKSPTGSYQRRGRGQCLLEADGRTSW